MNLAAGVLMMLAMLASLVGPLRERAHAVPPKPYLVKDIRTADSSAPRELAVLEVHDVGFLS